MKLLLLFAAAAATTNASAAFIQNATGGLVDPGLSSGSIVSDFIQTNVDSAAFTSAGLWDSGSSTVGGGATTGSLFVAFELTPLDRGIGGLQNPDSSFAGGQLLNGGGERAALGNNFSAFAYSYFGAGVGDIGSPFLSVTANQTILGLMEISYNASADDDITFSVSNDGGATFQSSSTTGDAAFDNFRFRAGHNSETFNNRWDFSDASFGTTALSAISNIPEPSSTALVGLASVALLLRRRAY